MTVCTATPGYCSRCSLTASTAAVGALVATGTGWYGSPVQHGAGTVGEHGVISLASWRRSVEQRGEPARAPRAPWSAGCCSSSRSTVITCAEVFCTSGRPRASTISPRGAGTTMTPSCSRSALRSACSGRAAARSTAGPNRVNIIDADQHDDDRQPPVALASARAGDPRLSHALPRPGPSSAYDAGAARAATRCAAPRGPAARRAGEQRVAERRPGSAVGAASTLRAAGVHERAAAASRRQHPTPQIDPAVARPAQVAPVRAQAGEQRRRRASTARARRPDGSSPGRPSARRRSRRPCPVAGPSTSATAATSTAGRLTGQHGAERGDHAWPAAAAR